MTAAVDSVDSLETLKTQICDLRPIILNYAFRLVHDRDEAEDLTQETILRALRNVHKYNPKISRLTTWLTEICKNAFLNYKRGRERRRAALQQMRPSAQPIQLGKLEPADINAPVTNLRSVSQWALLSARGCSEREEQERELLENIYELLNSLPPKFRIATRLRVVDELTHKEIADLLGIKIGTVKSRIFRGRQIIKRKLKEKLLIDDL